MVKPDAYSAAQELGQAITRAEDAENELRQTKIELENAHGTINRLNMEIAAERERVNGGDWVEKEHAEVLEGACRELEAKLSLVEAGLRGFCKSMRAMRRASPDEIEGTMRNHGVWRDAKEAQAG